MTVSARPYLKFRPRRPFWLEVPRSACHPRQDLPAGEIAYVRSRGVLAQQVRAAPAAVRELIDPAARVGVAPLDALRAAAGRSALFLMPSEAVGDNVLYAGAVREVARAFGLARLGVAFTGPATDVWSYLGMPIETFPLLLPERALATFDLVLDPTRDIPELDRLADEPVPIDATILARLSLPAAYRWAEPVRERRVRRVALFSVSTTPVRAIPPPLALHLARELGRDGLAVELVLDPRTRQGALYLQGAPGLAESVRLVPDLATVEDLIRYVRDLDYGVFCDSGPAHLAKLSETPGFCLLTSVADAAVRGPFRNLAPWQADYAGEFCRAPCGLVGAMSRGRGEAYGCMDTLRQPRAALVRPARLSDPETRRLLLETPPGCVASLTRDRDRILAAIRADLASLAASAGRPQTVGPA